MRERDRRGSAEEFGEVGDGGVSFEELINEGGKATLCLSPDYPLVELQELNKNLAASTHLIPGFIPADAGFLNIDTLLYDQFIEEVETYILPDRNIVTRMAGIAKNGMPSDPTRPDQVAAQLMAMAQIVDWQIEPSIAFHELASREGNERACEELAWFRAADTAQPIAWIRVALGQAARLQIDQPMQVGNENFAKRLSRWSRNYAVCLKIAELELGDIRPVDRFRNLLEWMKTDFFIAGPALLFAIVYFAPRSRRGGMMKNLRSPDRDRAISGVANAAWDITYLSDFTTKVQEGDFKNRRFVLATADQNLSEIANLLFLDSELADAAKEFAIHFAKIWPSGTAQVIANELVDAIELANRRPIPGSQDGSVDPIPKLIEDGEVTLRRWRDSAK